MVRFLVNVALVLGLVLFTVGCLALALSLSGCSTSPSPPAPLEIARAFQVVWDDIYDAELLPRPVVYFDPPSCDVYGSPGIATPSGVCVLGWTGQHETHVLWLGSWRTSAFAHELFHSFILDTTPRSLQSIVAGDPHHQDPRWISVVADKAAEWGAPDLTD